MTASDRAILEGQLIRDEGLRLKAYKCPAGYITVGVGRNLEGKGISKDEALYLLDRDIDECEADLKLRVPAYAQLAPARKRALLNMRFQLGVRGFFAFKNLLAAVNRHDYEAAAQHGFASKWAKQTPARAERTLTQLETGVDWA